MDGRQQHSSGMLGGRQKRSCTGTIETLYRRTTVEGRRRFERMGERCQGCGVMWTDEQLAAIRKPRPSLSQELPPWVTAAEFSTSPDELEEELSRLLNGGR